MSPRTCSSALLSLLLLPALTGTAAAAPAPAGHWGGDPQASHTFASGGPDVPGAEYLSVIEELDEPTRDRRVIADSAGHLLLQGRSTTDDGPVHRLVAVDVADGETAWVLDDVSADCGVVATDDGRIYAQLQPNSPSSSQTSADLVQVDATTGAITEQFTPDDTEDPGQSRLGVCRDSLRLGADDTVLVGYQGVRQTSGSQVLRAFSTAGGLAEAWIVQRPLRTGGQMLDRPVVSPDGSAVFLGHAADEDDPIRLAITRFDVATGDATGSVEVPGTAFTGPGGVLHDGDGVVVATQATGGREDPERLIRVSAGADLAVEWMVEARDDGPFAGVRTVARSGDQVIAFDGEVLTALALADATIRWTHRADSFTNNGAQVITDVDGNAYFSSFGGAALESLTKAGTRRFITGETPDFLGDGVEGEVQALGPIVDGRVHAVFRSAEGTVRPVLAAIGQGQERLDGITGEPIDIAIQACRYLFADDQARTVVLSRDDVFADTLAGAPLAGDHSCILFTAGGPDQPLDPRTAEEIERALPDGATVRIAGGTAAVSEQSEDALAAAGFTVERLAGAGRLETAVAIGRVVVAENPQAASEAVLAFAGNWPDAVTAGAAASARGIPVLLTGTEALSSQTADALAELDVTRTYVAGGPAVIAEQTAAAAPDPVRIAGQNRFGTAAEVAAQLWTGIAEPDSFVLANLEADFGWALALAAAPISVRLGAPQLGVRTTSLPAETEAYLREVGVVDPGVIALGDVTVIDDDVVTLVATGAG